MKLYDRISKGGVYVIAEMSANHAGSLDYALKIIEGAKDAGADCVKIQTYTPDSLTIDCHKAPYTIKGGLWDGMNYYDLYRQAMTPWEWTPVLMRKCKECDIDFLSTPFDNKGVDFLEEQGVEFYKIASFEMIDIPLIRHVASKHKPVIMSVGMGSEEEISEAIEAAHAEGNDDLVLLKCVSQYPAQYADMNLSVIPDMKKRFGKPVGFSDHSFGSLADIAAVSLGAQVIEKHVCLSRDIDTPDAGFSMEMKDFKSMVSDVRNTVKALGKPTYELTAHEKDGLSGRRSLVAVKPIKAGEPFTAENIRSVRPAIGVKPKYFYELINRRAKKDYEFGDPITMDELM
ncbi:MAG: pseudaminic acid synthase [Lachnospiraceae bacterium]|jgi:pseudaminic acid synthase|nr:pseudaminic acid synthase [Lachnospiraceae bacterium]MEE3460572.1 pseudaminic acid synthase [Lachnospiraceae bacterium]